MYMIYLSSQMISTAGVKESGLVLTSPLESIENYGILILSCITEKVYYKIFIIYNMVKKVLP